MAELDLGRIRFFDKGEYSFGTEYVLWDFVTSNGSTYLYVNKESSTGKPLTDEFYWKCLAKRGLSAFEVWDIMNGGNKTEAQFFDFIQSPANEAKNDYDTVVKPAIQAQGVYAQEQGDYAKAQGEAIGGYWVHKDTGVKTYFGLDDPSIVDGIMSAPSWGEDCSEVKLPLGVTGLGNSCFSECYRLTSVNIPVGVTSLGDYCFSYCEDLTSVNIPVGVTSLGDYCFSECEALTSVNIPVGVTSLGYRCFSSCYHLTSINIPVGVTSLGDYCFSECVALTSVNIPVGVTSLGDSCFSYCEALTSVNIPVGVTSLGYRCFYECPSLTSITIPENVTSLGRYCFYECPSLTSVTLENIIPPTIASDTFDSAVQKFYVPSSSVAAYKAATNWSAYADKIFPIA